MNAFEHHAVGFVLLCAVASPSYSAAPPPRVVVTEGDYVGYATVADALATFESEGYRELPGLLGEFSFAEPDNKTTWTFAGKESGAYPSVVRYVYTRSTSVDHIEFAVLCEASTASCDQFRSYVRYNTTQLAKMISGDSSVACRVTDKDGNCGVTPVRTQSDQQIYVEIHDDQTCTVDSVATPCPDVGRAIRAEHLMDNPKIDVCARATAKHDAIGKVLGGLTQEYLLTQLGCSTK